MEVEQVLHMKGGEDNQSYARNSSPQKIFMMNGRDIYKESVEELLKSRGCLGGECITIAELGCSSGPNALIVVEQIIANIARLCDVNTQNLEKLPFIQIFLNDLVANDFNIIFKSLPEFYTRIARFKYSSNSCFVAAMPGSFYNRLFPTRSIHLANSSSSLHWLSQVPSGLVTESGEYMNKGNVYVTKSSPTGVHKAYLEQFDKDFTLFLKHRSEELISNGHLVITIISKNDDGDDYTRDMFGLTLQEMVKEGFIKEEKLDSFNLPLYNPSADEMKYIIEKEGSFKIQHLQTFKQLWTEIYEENGCVERYISLIRAVFEPILATQFGKENMDEFFKRYEKILITHRMEFGRVAINNVVVSLINNVDK